MERGHSTITEDTIHLTLVDGTVWLTQSEIARLLDVFTQAVSANVQAIFKSKELFEPEVTQRHNYTDQQGLQCTTVFYNLDVVVALAFRMRGGRCRLFRAWVVEQIKCSVVQSKRIPMVLQLGHTLFLS